MAQGPLLPESLLRRSTLPFLAGTAVIVATILLWLAVREREQHHIRHMTRMVAGGVQADIEADLETRFLSPMRNADLWNITATTSREVWQAKAHVFLKEHSGFIAIEWAGRDHQRWSLPETWAAATENETQTELDAAARHASDERGQRAPLFSERITASDGLAVRRVIVPIYQGGELQGIGTASFRERESLDSLLEDVTGLGYAISISEGEREIYHFPAATTQRFGQEWVESTGVKSAGIDWTLSVQPTPGLLAEMRTHLPQFVFGMGLALSLLVVLTAHFAQSVKMKNESLTREIAERKRTATALQASEQRLNGILETSPDAVIVVDAEQRIRVFNKGAEAIFGYSSDEVKGQALDLLLPARFHHSHRAEISRFGEAQAINTKRMGGPREVFGRRRDGSEFPIEASISKLQTPTGILYTSILRDVTERVQARETLARAHADLEARVRERTAELAQAKELLEREFLVRSQAEDSLRFSENRLQAILDNCTAVIYMKDVDGHYILINRWYEILFNIKNEQTVGKTDRDIFPEEIATALRQNDLQVIKSQTPIEFEELVVHPDGSAHTYVALKFLIRDANQKPYAVCGISTDITRQKQSEALLSRLSGGLMRLQDEERQRLARDLHEGTAQMLAALGINLGMAQSASGGESRIVRSALAVSMELIEQTTKQVKAMAYLLHPPGLDEFGLASALRWYTESFSSRTGIEVSVKISSNLERFDRDIEVAVFRILQEALSNVQRHSDSKAVKITLQQDAYELVLEIADCGRGLPKEIEERVACGLPVPGVGITSMRERVRRLGGTLHIHSGPQGMRLIAKLPTGSIGLKDVVEDLKMEFRSGSL